jgi:hypothetical protein
MDWVAARAAQQQSSATVNATLAPDIPAMPSIQHASLTMYHIFVVKQGEKRGAKGRRVGFERPRRCAESPPTAQLFQYCHSKLLPIRPARSFGVIRR